jgi:hypothetical protein
LKWPSHESETWAGPQPYAIYSVSGDIPAKRRYAILGWYCILQLKNRSNEPEKNKHNIPLTQRKPKSSPFWLHFSFVFDQSPGAKLIQGDRPKKTGRFTSVPHVSTLRQREEILYVVIREPAKDHFLVFSILHNSHVIQLP